MASEAGPIERFHLGARRASTVTGRRTEGRPAPAPRRLLANRSPVVVADALCPPQESRSEARSASRSTRRARTRRPACHLARACGRGRRACHQTAGGVARRAHRRSSSPPPVFRSPASAGNPAHQPVWLPVHAMMDSTARASRPKLMGSPAHETVSVFRIASMNPADSRTRGPSRALTPLTKAPGFQ